MWLFKQLTSKIAINREETKACLKVFKIPPFYSLWSDLFLCTVLVNYEYDRLLFALAPTKPHLWLLPGEPLPSPQSPAHTLQFASATGSEMDHLTILSQPEPQMLTAGVIGQEWPCDHRGQRYPVNWIFTILLSP